jgi:pimeloyl-ACP methyl ester carboxylesterase
VLPDPFAAGAFFALDQVIDRGWALVATDYVGLGTEGPHPYLIGEPVGRSVLDSVRAAKQLTAAGLGDETVVWGHSQGGGAALWTGILAPEYAPDANVIGVAALAPASDLVGLMENLANVPGGSIFATYALDAYADVYDDVELGDYVRPAARSSFDEVAGRCLAEPSAVLSVLGSLAFDMSVFSDDLTSGPLLGRLVENVPIDPIDAPLLLAQGEADSLVVPAVQDAYVEARCSDGQAIDYRTYPGRDHVPLVEADSPLIPELLEWTVDRFSGAPPTPTCPAP